MSSRIGRASVRIPTRRPRARIGGEDIKVLHPSIRPATITSGFISLLLATVAALVNWPFCRPLLWLLFSLMALFFLFAATVISLSFLVIFWAVRQWLSPGSVGSSSKMSDWFVSPRGAGTEGQTSDLWDRWLDGA
jgi:hypothetical protein